MSPSNLQPNPRPRLPTHTQIQYKYNPDYAKALLILKRKLLCKGRLQIDISDVDDPNEEVFFHALQVTFDVKGYFSAAMTDYRERLERRARDEVVKRQLRKGREEKKRARKGRETIKKCEELVEKLSLDLKIIEDNEVCMKHRPTEVCIEGAKLAVCKISDICRTNKGGLVAVSEKDLEDMITRLKKVVTHAKKCVKQAVALADKVVVAKTMALPDLESALVNNGCSLFFERLVMSGYVDMKGVTLLAPLDDAFLGEGMDGFDEECFGVHVIDGPYNSGDMLQLNSGYTQPRSQNERHTIRTRMDLGGTFTFWLKGDSEPRRLVKAVAPDVNVAGGTVVHVVDKILHPSDAFA